MTALANLVFTFNMMLCAYAVFSCWYKDTVLQAIGISMVGIASAALLYHSLFYNYVDTNTFALALGMGVYGFGTFIKIYIKTKGVRRYVRQRRKAITQR